MEFKEIQTLIKLVSEAGVDEVSIEKKDFKLSIKKNEKQVTYTTAPVMHAPVMAAAPVAPAAPSAQAPVASAPAEEKSNLITIKAPMIGTFYRASGPDKAAFSNVGDAIAPGKVLCIIEAMKLFNEIESEVSGKIVKILVENGTPVEFDQPLFLVQPN
jgi:acetyl-CoA carboxylase biotin carboxyl carrier protein